jgi:hypothetical protein
MTLENYLTEAISTGKHRSKYYDDFPKDPTDKKAIIEWLKDNGYTEIKNNGAITPLSVFGHYERTGEKCYALGLYNKKEETHWIMMFDGVNQYFIRTVPGRDKLRNVDGNAMMRYDKNYNSIKNEYMTFDEIRKEIDKHNSK